MRRATRIARATLAALFVVAAAAGPRANAQQTLWKQVPLGDWFIASNWSAGVPNSGNSAIFGNPNADGALVTAPGAQALNVFVGVITTNAGGMVVGRKGSLTLSAPGGGGTPGDLTIGNRLVIGQSTPAAVGEGTLNISNGGDVISNSVDVATTADGPFGTINVADPGSNLNTGRLTLGNNTGHGVLNVQNGAIVNCQNEGLIAGTPFLPGSSAATGVATVTGAGSKWIVNSGFVVGYNANGSLTVSNGGDMQSLEASIATLPGSVGTVTVTGANSRWLAIPFSNIFVGGWSGSTASGGAGSISVFDGGQVITSLLKVFSNGFVRVDNGSTSVPGLIARGDPPSHTLGGSLGDVLVGHTGSGRMEIRDGGAVRGFRGYIGFANGSNGAALVTGQGTAQSFWSCDGSVWVGNGGNGTLEVRNGARVASGGNGYIAFTSGTTGSALVSGTDSLWTTSANLYIGGNGGGPGGSGTLQIENGGAVSAAAITLYNTGTLALGVNPQISPLTSLGGSILGLSNFTFSQSLGLGVGGVHVFTNFKDLTFTGLLSGSGALDKTGSFIDGPGTLTLVGPNSYSGGTTVSAGRLLVDNTSGSATGPGPVTVTTITGNTVFGGKGIVSGPVTINANSILLGGGGVSASGALTVANNLTLNPGAKIQLVLGGSGAHSTLARSAGVWTFPNNLAFRIINANASPGFYNNIITGLTSDPGNVGSWTIETADFTGSFSYDGAGNIDLNLTAAPPAVCAWNIGASYPIPILDNGAATVGTAIYSFSGVSNSALTANSYRFDGTSWTPIAPLPEAVESPTVVSDGTFIYIMGGNAGPGTLRNSLYRYNPASNTYTALASSNVATMASGGAALNGKLYKIGGFMDLGSGAATNAVEIYDIASNSWSSAASYPLPVSFVSTFVRNGLVYGAGGIDYGPVSVTAKTYGYDPNTNIWSDNAIADLPATRSSAATLPDSGGVILAGGEVGGGSVSNISASAIRWNAATNTWTTVADLLQRRARAPGVVVAGNYSVIGGRDPLADAFTGSTNHQVYSCPLTMPSQVVSRKLHSGTPFDINLPLTGSVGIECRSGGVSNVHQIIITFPTAITFTSAAITSGSGSVSGSSGSGTATVTIDLTSVSNAQHIETTLFNVNNSGNIVVPMGVLLGDTTGNGSVNATDVSQAKLQSGQALSGSNFRNDVTANGSINATDVSNVKLKSGTALPP